MNSGREGKREDEWKERESYEWSVALLLCCVHKHIWTSLVKKSYILKYIYFILSVVEIY